MHFVMFIYHHLLFPQTAGSVVEPAILQKSDERLYALHVRDTPSFLSSNVERLHQELDLVRTCVQCSCIDHILVNFNAVAHGRPHC